MDFSVSDIISVVSLFVGGGGAGAFFTWHWQRRKAQAEAASAEVNTTKEVQDVYQQMNKDLQAENERLRTNAAAIQKELEAKINEQKERLDKQEREISELRQALIRHAQLIESFRPYTCQYAMTCQNHRPLASVLQCDTKQPSPSQYPAQGAEEITIKYPNNDANDNQ